MMGQACEGEVTGLRVGGVGRTVRRRSWLVDAGADGGSAVGRKNLRRQKSDVSEQALLLRVIQQSGLVAS